MRCRWCGDPIGLLRRLSDREFCCDNHRRRGPRISASLIRDIEFEDDPHWSAAHLHHQRNQNRSASPGFVLTMTGALALILAANIWVSDNSGAGGSFAGPAPRPRAAAEPRPPGIQRAQPSLVDLLLDDLIPDRRALDLRADFSSAIADWQGNASGWSVRNGIVHPGKLRLWKPTLQSADYDLKFRASIERRAIGWTFRASDNKNYYAARLMLNRNGKPSTASLLRYSVVDSAASARTELPLPIPIERNRWYNFTVTVKGSRFLTLIDGNPVDDWTDTKHARGGIGFFTEDGESAALEWAEFREHKGFLNHFFAACLFFPPPSLP